MIVKLKEIVMGNTAEWCKLPYPDHPDGCPNFGKKKGCPPTAPLATDLITDPYYLVYLYYDLEAQEKRMKEKHPKWSTRQARCCLYWQRTVMKEVMVEAKFLIKTLSSEKSLFRMAYGYDEPQSSIILENPEGAGIDLFKTCEQAGIHLERDYLHQRYVYKMVIVGKTK